MQWRAVGLFSDRETACTRREASAVGEWDLDLTFYCQRHYEEVKGQVAPACAKKRPKAKAWPRAAQHRRLARSKPMLSALLLQLRNGRHVRGMRRPMGHGRDDDRMMSWW